MDFHIDTSWCPVCDRQIQPKRYLVPHFSQQLPPSPSPPSPTKLVSPDAPPLRRNKSGAARPRPGGLVHGTGRVKPNGALKRVDSLAKNQPPIPVPAAPVKLRTVIDQGPIPLYCSDECQMADITHNHNGFAHDFDPHRSSPPLPPVPPNSFDGPISSSVNGSDSDSSGSSVDSHISPSIAVLAAIYNFPSIPPPLPVFDELNYSSSDSDHTNNYESGVMMASERIKEALCRERPKRSFYTTNNYPPEPRKPIPGWTDGSQAWRSALYGFSAPTDLSKMDAHMSEKSTAAYRSFVASPHRSRGVFSTLSDANRTPATCSPGCTAPLHRMSTETEELYSKYSESLSRRSESRTCLFPSSSPSSSQSPTPSQRRERSLLKPGAEGKLLVPDVKMRVRSGSSSSLSSAGCGSSYLTCSRRGSSTKGSDTSREDMRTRSPLAGSKERTVETRSWSYDNIKTYPVMQLPPKKERRIGQKVIDGQVVDVEVEVEIVQPLKRLFLFPGKETNVERR